MALVVRPYTDADREGFGLVRSRVYRGGAPVDPEEDLMRADTFGVVAEQDGKIVGAETEIDMTCTVRGEPARCAGIAAVGVLPEFRRGGIGLEMLTRALPIYRERGSQIASLLPFRADYYRRAGYFTAGARIEVTCPTARLPAVAEDLGIRELPPGEYAEAAPCYEAFARRYSGMNLRRPEQWASQLGGKTPFAIYVAGDPPEAYVSTRLKWEFWTEAEIRDFAWTTPRGYRAMLGFFRGLAINKTALQWPEPTDGPMLWRFDDQGITRKYDTSMMYRALDVPGLLKMVHCDADGEFTVAVRDPHLPENDGPWWVRFRPEGTEVEKGSQPDLEMEIGAITQALLGEPSLESQVGLGSVAVYDEAGMRQALKLLKPFPTYCLDLF